MDYSVYKGRGINKVTHVDRPITYLANQSEWVDRIYCIEAEDNVYTADKVLGSTYGVTNAPIQALANRTYYLKEYVDRLTDHLNALLIAISPQLSNIKAIVVSTTAPTDTEHFAWLNYGVNVDQPTFKFTFDNGTTTTNPVLKLTLENGRIVYLRTDGNSADITPITTDTFEG